jgi:hypothetical protein
MGREMVPDGTGKCDAAADYHWNKTGTTGLTMLYPAM